MKTVQFIATVAFFAGTAVPATAAQLVTNPGFETGDFSGWNQINDTSFSGVTCGDFGGTFPPEGNCQAFFGPVDPGGGGIIQTISTIPGRTYDLSFQLANLAGEPNAFGLFWDGGFVSIDFDEPPFPYTMITRSLIASGINTDLGFIFFHEPSFFLVDEISLVEAGAGAVPEPSTWAMMLLGFGFIGGAMRSAKRRQWFPSHTLE